jgi:hypothetical protein
MEFLAVKNWHKFQHGKTRDYPWIKLHKAAWRDHDFLSLSVSQRYHLISCWVFASDMEGFLPGDERYLNRLCNGHKMNLKELIERGFLIKINAKSLDDARQMLAQSRIDKSRVEESRVEDIAPPSAGAPSPDPEPKKKTNPEIKIFIDHYFQEYQKKFGRPYLVNSGKDTKAVQRALGTFPLEHLKRTLTEFFADDLEWQGTNPDHTISLFVNQINRYGNIPKKREPSALDKKLQEQSQLIACADCGHIFRQAAMHELDGKQYCTGCAINHKVKPEQVQELLHKLSKEKGA